MQVRRRLRGHLRGARARRGRVGDGCSTPWCGERGGGAALPRPRRRALPDRAALHARAGQPSGRGARRSACTSSRARRRRRRSRSCRMRGRRPPWPCAGRSTCAWRGRAPSFDESGTARDARALRQPHRRRRARPRRGGDVFCAARASTTAAGSSARGSPGSRRHSGATRSSPRSRCSRFAPHLAPETLRFLGAYQGRRDDAVRATRSRGRSCTSCGAARWCAPARCPTTPTTAPSTPRRCAWSCRRDQAWTGDLRAPRELWPNVIAALEWIERGDRQGDGFLATSAAAPAASTTRAGRTAATASRSPTGGAREPPIALVEVQGYVVRRLPTARAWMARRLGERDRAAKWSARVEPFLRIVRSRVLDTRDRLYALAIDGAGSQVPTITSNPGHLLWSRAVPDAIARGASPTRCCPTRCTAAGASARSARGAGGLQPDSATTTARCGRTTTRSSRSGWRATAWARTRCACSRGCSTPLTTSATAACPSCSAAWRAARGSCWCSYPVSCSPQAWASGALFMLLQAVLGLDPDATARRLRIRNPRLPPQRATSRPAGDARGRRPRQPALRTQPPAHPRRRARRTRRADEGGDRESSSLLRNASGVSQQAARSRFPVPARVARVPVPVPVPVLGEPLVIGTSIETTCSSGSRKAGHGHGRARQRPDD